MSVLNTSERAVAELTSWMYVPRSMIAVGAPCGFMLFAHKEWIDFLLRSKNIPEVLNPWVGIIFLCMASFLTVHILTRIWWHLTWPIRKWKKQHSEVFD